MRPAAAVIAFVIGACGSGDNPAGVDPITYSGEYVLTRVNGQAPPVTVVTAWAEGNLTQGGMSIDWDTNYWLNLVIFRPGAGTSIDQARGNAIGSQADEISFVDRDFNVQWVAMRTDTTLVIADLRGLHTEFRRVGPYRRRS
jgi:hypothetical protein